MRHLTWPLVLCVVVGALGGALADRLVSFSLMPGAPLGALSCSARSSGTSCLAR